ncbi:hypothetical protein L596_003374 [Steinernema carpocapsae]|uniref:Uncharacterized protein n=1 Tax=Steinernema carpocapsae TaxID=34508 RepID=A0A4U8USD2_STECR|nr:hypothetical protein L596_003374 [Steinernema carpocapsae]
MDRIGSFTCCELIRDENAHLRTLLIEERQKFKRLNVLYQQLLASFSVQTSGSDVPVVTFKSPQPPVLPVNPSKLCTRRNPGDTATTKTASSTPKAKRSGEPRKPSQCGPNTFYFVDINGVVKHPSVSLSDAARQKMHRFMERSEARQRVIREVSRRRAVFAAHRRAAAYNVMQGRVELADVNNLLTTDLTRIEAFPRTQMINETRRRVRQSVHFINNRRKQASDYEKTINNVLSFCFSQNLLAANDKGSSSMRKLDARVALARERIRSQRNVF